MERALNAATDVIIICIPIPVLWRLKVSNTQKIQLSAIFALGGGCVLFSSNQTRREWTNLIIYRQRLYFRHHPSRSNRQFAVGPNLYVPPYPQSTQLPRKKGGGTAQLIHNHHIQQGEISTSPCGPCSKWTLASPAPAWPLSAPWSQKDLAAPRAKQPSQPMSRCRPNRSQAAATGLEKR